MTNLTLLLLCLGAGAALRRWGLVPVGAAGVLNQLLVMVFMPALTFLHLAVARLDSHFLLPVLAPWLIFGAGYLFFEAVGRRMKLSRATIGALILTGGISSTSFVGFPIFELLYGREGLELGIMMSQAGSFLVGVTLGVAVASWYGAAEPSWGAMFRNVLRFPPFLAFVLAMVANAAGYQHPELVRGVLEKISGPFPVIALLSVGLQMNLRVPPAQARPLVLGLSYKLLVAPLLIYGLYQAAAHQHGRVVDLCILGAAIGPMNTAAVVAERYGLDPPLAAQMVGLGIPLSLPLLALLGWWFTK
ncbi:Auxin Efflux Carrier [Hymenobacter roseosalivarius DSM 11622]|uniref:Auxin Efflux Carrier n=1 Tax=Hymenobacter roseosalivarius DSM 11622 TaxID=645990 RepID=A0A1W1W0M3_9BACT|nr:AEC family transporter [Hymenobacter roseosalivarius]SMB99155.1 Auxin Efflux Carrier [Hymenobacter roseosalivarius DSM 11622]